MKKLIIEVDHRTLVIKNEDGEVLVEAHSQVPSPSKEKNERFDRLVFIALEEWKDSVCKLITSTIHKE